MKKIIGIEKIKFEDLFSEEEIENIQNGEDYLYLKTVQIKNITENSSIYIDFGKITYPTESENQVQEENEIHLEDHEITEIGFLVSLSFDKSRLTNLEFYSNQENTEIEFLYF